MKQISFHNVSGPQPIDLSMNRAKQKRIKEKKKGKTKQNKTASKSKENSSRFLLGPICTISFHGPPICYLQYRFWI